METFSALLAICARNSPVPGEFPAQRPVTRSFDVFFELRLNKRLSKQSWGWWFEKPSCPLWRHSNVEQEFSCALHRDIDKLTPDIYLLYNLTVNSCKTHGFPRETMAFLSGHRHKNKILRQTCDGSARIDITASCLGYNKVIISSYNCGVQLLHHVKQAISLGAWIGNFITQNMECN